VGFPGQVEIVGESARTSEQARILEAPESRPDHGKWDSGNAGPASLSVFTPKIRTLLNLLLPSDTIPDRVHPQTILALRSIPIQRKRRAMDTLDRLENDSIFILREAFNRVERLAMLWSLGKDSTVMAWLARKAFFGHVPFPMVHVDTGRKFPEMYAYRDRFAAEWGLDLIRGTCPPIEDIDPGLPPAARASARKTEGLKRVIEEHRFTGVIAGIRRDEEGTRAKERVFSPRDPSGRWDVRNQPPEFWGLYNTDYPDGVHLRVHPLLAWTEIDIWRYIGREGIPVVDLYFARDGKRYRSLGDQDITFPISSEAATIDDIIAELEATREPERAGRAMDHEGEGVFERLRTDGYL
jgi:sulfate adenylyltransferase subunit 2